MIIRNHQSLESSGSFVKVVIDIKREILSAGCELHIDCADELVQDGSDYNDVWGANVYPEDKNIDFVSLINIRPQIDNRSMQIENEETRNHVEEIIKKLVL